MDSHSTLPLAIPALESLHQKLSKRCDGEKYAHHQEGLSAACDSIKQYYDLSSKSKAPFMSMGKHPMLHLDLTACINDEHIYDSSYTLREARSY